MVMTTPELVDLTLPSAVIPNKKLGLKYGTWKIFCLQYSYLANLENLTKYMTIL